MRAVDTWLREKTLQIDDLGLNPVSFIYLFIILDKLILSMPHFSHL